MRMRPHIAMLGALAMAASLPASNTMQITAAPEPTPVPDLKRRQARPSKFERESKRGSRHYTAKAGNTNTDNARRERAEAKRARKAQSSAVSRVEDAT